MRIAVDFDGTCVKHSFPRVGADVVGAVATLRQLQKDRHAIFLFTMRSGEFLDDAIQWFRDNGIVLNGVQTDPTQKKWTTSPKCFADLYIDDAAYGAPLEGGEDGERPYLNWSGVLAHVSRCQPTKILPVGEAKEGRCATK